MILLSSFVSATLRSDNEIYYKMEEAASPLTDSNPNNIQSACTNCPAFQQPGIIDFGFDFDGVSDELRFDANTEIDSGTNKFTINFWAKTDNNGVLQNFYGYETPITVSPFTAMQYKGNTDDSIGWNVIYVNAGNNLNVYTAANAVTDTNWHMYTFMRTGDFTAEIWVDGVDKTNAVTTAGVAQSIIQDRQYIGSTGTGATEFDGMIDEWSFYSTNLTLAQITELYNGGAPGSDQQYPFAPEFFNITVSNYFNGTPITSFYANISNSTGSRNITTTNGTINWHKEDIVNITVSVNDYFNRTYLNWNTSVQLDSEHWQSILNIEAFDITFSISIANSNGTVNRSGVAQFNTSSDNITTFFINADTYNYTIQAEGFTDNETGFETLTALQNKTIQVNFSRDVQNRLWFFDIVTSNPIENGSVIVTYPGGGFVETLTTNSSGAINFSYVKNFIPIYGSYMVSFAEQGFIPSIFNETINSSLVPLNESYNVTRANLIVNILDRETGLAITNLVNVILLNVLNQSTTTGTTTIYNLSIVGGDYNIMAMSDGYLTEQRTVSFTNQENVSLTFQLLNATGTSTEFLYVNCIDEFYTILEDATVSLYEYDIATFSFVKISEEQSNVNGEVVFGVELNSKSYYLTASKTIGGILYFAQTNPEIILTADETRNLVLYLSDPFGVLVSDYINMDYSETFVNNISTIYMSFTTTDGFDAEVCVGYFNMSNNASLLTETCIVTGGVYVANPTLIDRNYNYEGRIYQKYLGEDINYMTYYYPSDTSLDFIFSEINYSEPIFIWLWIVLLVVCLLMKNMMLFSIGGIILTWLQFFRSPSIALASASVLKTMILIFMMNSTRRREDLN